MSDLSENSFTPDPTALDSGVLIIGLGRFGSSLAISLEELGYEVIAVDSDMARVQEHADALTQAVQLDSMSEKALRQIGAADVRTAVVCIGDDIEASVVTTAVLADIGVAHIWAKAITKPHGKILERVGAHHVVYPEYDMGARVAHLLSGRMLEYMALDDDFVLAETSVPASAVGKSLTEAQLRAKHNVTVVCVKPGGSRYTYATPDTKLAAGDLIVVAGTRKDVDGFMRTV
jgi:trk system potassium uptake protein